MKLEKDLEKEKLQKVQMEAYFKSQAVKNSHTLQAPIISNSEENINDLLTLANEELENKSKLIYELQSRIEFLECKHLDSMNQSQLNQLKSFYGTKLSSVVAAMGNLK